MSYILDALRRAERERHRQAGDPVAEVANGATASPPPSSKMHNALILVGVIVAALLVANLVVLLLNGHNTSTTASTAASTTATTNAAPQAGTQTTARPAPVAPTKPIQTANIPASNAVESASTNPSTSPTRVAAQPAVPTLIPAGASTASTPTKAANPIADAGAIHTMDELTRHKPKAQSRPRPRPQPPAVKRVATAPAASLPHGQHAETTATAAPETPADKSGINTTALAAHPAAASSSTLSTSAVATAPPPASPSAKDLTLMPDSYRANFPRITVQVHVYEPDPARCWIMVGGKRYRVGDTLPQGPKIDKIVPEGIVFDWKGHNVLYPS